MTPDKTIAILMYGLETALNKAITAKQDDIIHAIHETFRASGICRSCAGKGERRGIETGIEGYHTCFDCNGTGRV